MKENSKNTSNRLENRERIDYTFIGVIQMDKTAKLSDQLVNAFVDIDIKSIFLIMSRQGKFIAEIKQAGNANVKCSNIYQFVS